MVRVVLAVLLVSAASGCDKNKDASTTSASPATPTPMPTEERQGDPRPEPNFNPEGAASADASILQKGAAALDPADARARFQSAPNMTLKGEARLNQRDDGVHINVEVAQGPAGMHGIHIHEKPDCSDIPGKSMGAHFSPEKNPHGLPPGKHHLGDLGNIEINKEGEAEFEIVVPRANLMKADAMSFLNRALVIHEKRDVGTGDSGESGKPIACATIVAD